MTSMAAPSPHPPNSAPVPEIKLDTTGRRHEFGLVVGSRPRNVSASMGAGGYPAGVLDLLPVTASFRRREPAGSILVEHEEVP